MLKIPKGLKKKKKGKKSKRKGEEELFTEEELEQYRKEHQSQAQPPQPEYEQEPSVEAKPSAENDEWSKFNALTTGVDSILKKTQGDLDRIKSTSFFQRVPTGPKSVDRCGKALPLRREAQQEGQRWIGFEEKKGGPEQPQEERKQEATKPREEAPPEQSAAPALSASESEEDDFDDIFDTSYVEAVEKGEVKLAYIPDSPEEEVDTGPDPFDTSYADRVIKGPEVSKKGKKLVNIGAAVEVLTGRIDHVTTSSSAVKKAKRRIPRDLLLENPDNDDLAEVAPEEVTVSRSLLDDDTENGQSDVPVDLSISLHTQFLPVATHEEENASQENTQKDILNAFDTFDQDDDEFAQLATESLNKPVEVQSFEPQLAEAVVEDGSWAAFEDSKPKPVRPPPPRPAAGPTRAVPEEPVSPAVDVSPIDPDCDGPDPFDTTFAENILPGKAELKQIEDEILNSDTQLPHSDSDFDFNPREGEKPYINNRRKSSVHIHVTDPTGIRESISGLGNSDVVDLETLKPIHRDLLGGSSTDLSQLADSPIAPQSSEESDHIEYSDPFDTSIVDLVSAPGKAELKFIEKELLGESEIKRSLSDPDFDPRAEEYEETRTDSQRKPSRPENLLVNKSVLFKIPNEDSFDKDAKKPKPLTPYYAREASVTDEEVDTKEDSFETSPGDSDLTNKPVVSILKNSQQPADIKRSSSNQDINADDEEEFLKGKFSQLRRHSDFPINFSKPEASAASAKANKSRVDFLSITEEESVDIKVLTPFQEEQSIDFDVDPFDTSSVGNILLPGKTELKFLENELLSHTSTSNTLVDPDFDPRAEEHKEVGADDLLAPSDDVFQAKALTPQIPDPVTGFLIETADNEIDPFDTSIADNIGPGKTELKLLESELMN